MAITKDMTIMNVIGNDENIADILMQSGMHCLGCMMAHDESLEQACEVHGIDCDALVKEINEYLESK